MFLEILLLRSTLKHSWEEFYGNEVTIEPEMSIGRSPVCNIIAANNNYILNQNIFIMMDKKCINMQVQSIDAKLLVEETLFYRINTYTGPCCINVVGGQCVQNKVCSLYCYLYINSVYNHHSSVVANSSSYAKNYIIMSSISPCNNENGFGLLECINGSIKVSHLNATQSRCMNNNYFYLGTNDEVVSCVSFSSFCDTNHYIDSYKNAISFHSNAIMNTCNILRNDISYLISIWEEAKCEFKKCIIKHNKGSPLINARGQLTIVDSIISENEGNTLIYTSNYEVDSNSMSTKPFYNQLEFLNSMYCETETPFEMSNNEIDETLLVEHNANTYQKILPALHFFIN